MSYKVEDGANMMQVCYDLSFCPIVRVLVAGIYFSGLLTDQKVTILRFHVC